MEEYFWFCILIALNSTILICLAGYVSSLRLKYRISIGDGDNKQLHKAMRTHANGVEQVPIYCFLILGLSITHSSETVLAIFVLTFAFARISHAIGMLSRYHIARRIGAAATYLLQLLASMVLLFNVLT
ncbi:MAG: putative membrane protein YecN with MAPEG domain [Flavobacteriales bacterium]|jgi:uncharacterized membrane protein YecN with MAPEG domain